MAMILDLLAALVVVNFFVILLCLGVYWAGRWFKQSGTVVMRADEREFEVERGQSLLSACFGRGIYLPSACGGKGTCGKCDVQVRGGGGALTPFEKVQLSKEQLKAGVRLACQVRVRESLDLSLGATHAAVAFRAELLSVQPVTKDIALFEFKALDTLPETKAGQYFQVKYQLPWELVLRAYSVSSMDMNEGRFTLDVRRVEGGLVSGFLHSLAVGAKLEFVGPFGEMCLEADVKAKSVVLVAGGVGLAPMRFVVESLLAGAYQGEVLLFQGASSRDGLYLEKHFTELASKEPRFRYFPALSEPLLQDGWVGFEGMIHELLEVTELEAGAGLAMLCGPKPMIIAVEKILMDKGFSSDRILADPFDF